MQRIGRHIAVLYHGDADVAVAGIETIGLRARRVSAGQHAQARLLPELHRRAFAAAVLRHVEPEEEAAGRALVAVAVADDLVGEIELGAIERAVFFHVGLVVVGRDRDFLRRDRHLRRGDRTQVEEWLDEGLVAGDEAHAQSGKA